MDVPNPHVGERLKALLQDVKALLHQMRLRSRLLLFAVVVLIPMIIFGVISVMQSVNHAKQQMLNNSLAMAKVVASNIIEKTENTERMLQGLSRSSAVRTHNIQGTRELFIDVFPIQQGLVNLFVADREGHVYASIVWQGLRSRSIAEDPDFQRALKTGETTISGSRVSYATDQHVIRMMVPFRAENNEISGILTADISLSQLQQRMVSIGIEEGTSVIVTDRNGTVLLHPNYKHVYDEVNLGTWPSVQAALTGQEGSLEHLNPLDDRSWLWAYAPIHRTGWAVVVGYPTAIAYPSVNDILIRSLFLLVGMVLLAIIVALYLSQRLTEPLRNLTGRALAISRGNFNQETEVKGSKEVCQLAEAFNIMSTNLSEHMSKLALAKEKNLREAKRLQRLLARTISLQEKERHRIASDMHDSTSQLILGSLFETEAAKEMVTVKPDLAKEKLTKVENLLEQTSVEMRRVIYDLRPPLLDDMGLATALERCVSRYVERTGIPVKYECAKPDTRLPQETEMALYRIAQEALNNIQKHSHADQAEIKLAFSDHLVNMVIYDDGVGFSPQMYLSGKMEHLGLKGMIERAENVGASLEIDSAPGHGTSIMLDLSLHL